MIPVKPTHDAVFVDIVDRDIRQKDLGNGQVLHLLPDDVFGLHDPVTGGKHRGARPRLARVLEIGSEVDGEVKPGDLVLCDALKWSRRIPLGRIGTDTVYFWRIKVTDILGVIDSDKDYLDYMREFTAKMLDIEFNIGRY